MRARAMIVVGGGTSTRFGGDKLLTRVAGAPLVGHTIRALTPGVDRCLLVCRADQIEEIESLGLGVEIVPGGTTRTESEIAGLSALGDAPHDLIGIHDAARPLASGRLVESLFEAAGREGGAIPVLANSSIVDRSSLALIPDVGNAQTPQVFQAGLLHRAYRLAREEGFEGHDTAEVVAHFTDTRIVAVPGESDNLKVTYPDDLDLIEELLQERVHNGPR